MQGVASLALIPAPLLLLELEVMYGVRLSQNLKTVVKGSPQYLPQGPYPQSLKTLCQSIDLLRTQVEMGGCDPSGAVASDFLDIHCELIGCSSCQ